MDFETLTLLQVWPGDCVDPCGVEMCRVDVVDHFYMQLVETDHVC